MLSIDLCHGSHNHDLSNCDSNGLPAGLSLDDVVLRHTLPVFTGLGRAQLLVGTLMEQ